MREAPAGAAGGLWRNRDFNKLWLGESVSLLGTAVSGLAIPSLAVLGFGAGPAAVGLLIASGAIPYPLLALGAGVWLDRVPRRPPMIVADVGRALVLAAVPLLAVSGHLALWHLYAVALLSGVLGVLFDIAYLSYLPSLVPTRDLGPANARLELSVSSAEVIGPGLAGLLIQLVGAATAVAIDAATFLASALSLVGIRRPEDKPAPATGSAREDLIEGVRHVWHDHTLRLLCGSLTGVVFGTHMAEAVVVVYAYRTLGLGPGQVGAAFALGGAGGIAGAVLTGPISRRFGPITTIVGSGAVCSMSWCFMPLARIGLPLVVMASVLALGTVAGAIENILQVTVRQATTPDRLRSRMNATFRTAYFAAFPLASIAGGLLGSVIGLAPVFIIGGAVGAASSLLLLRLPRADRDAVAAGPV